MTEVGQVNENDINHGGEGLPVIGIAKRLGDLRQAGKPRKRPAPPSRRRTRQWLWLVVALVVMVLAGGGFLVYHFAFASEKKPASDRAAIATCVANLGELNAAIDAYVAKNVADPPNLEALAKQDLVKIPSCPSGGIYSLKMVMTKDGPRLRAVCSLYGSEEQAKEKAGTAPAS